MAEIKIESVQKNWKENIYAPNQIRAILRINGVGKYEPQSGIHLLHNNVCQTHHRKIMQMKSISQEGKFFIAQICRSCWVRQSGSRKFIAPLKVFFLPRLLSGLIYGQVFVVIPKKFSFETKKIQASRRKNGEGKHAIGVWDILALGFFCCRCSKLYLKQQKKLLG